MTIGLVGCTSGDHRAPSTGTRQSSRPNLSNQPNQPSRPAPGAASGPYWLLEDYDVQPLLAAGLPQRLLADYFDNPRTFLITRYGRARATQVALLPRATEVLSFDDRDQLSQALSSGAVPSSVVYLLYDPERWPATPVAQQRQPFAAAAEVFRLAKQYGKRLIFTPAADLASVANAAYARTNRFTGYLQLRFAEQGARTCDVFEIQAQQVEGTVAFTSFVGSAVGQARAANPRALILVGLTTKAPRQRVTGQLLLAAYRATRSEVAGYWINIPGGTPAGPQNAAAAVDFLRALAPSLGY